MIRLDRMFLHVKVIFFPRYQWTLTDGKKVIVYQLARFQ